MCNNDSFTRTLQNIKFLYIFIFKLTHSLALLGYKNSLSHTTQQQKKTKSPGKPATPYIKSLTKLFLSKLLFTSLKPPNLPNPVTTERK